MNTKLIIVDGHSSVGKSSISKSVFTQINLNQAAYWLHEECENHPIRQDEFSFGALDTTEGMELNRLGMLDKWREFRDSIKSSGKICITEGCLLHAYDRYFIHSIWDEQEIAAYYSQVIDILRELNPLIVLLYRPNLRTSLEKAFAVRGNRWRDLMLKRDDKHMYFKAHTYIDENSMFDAIEFEQRREMAFFEGLGCRKVKIDTSEERWDDYVEEIISLLGFAYTKVDYYPFDPGQFVGAYRWENSAKDGKWIIGYDDANKCLFTTLFWPYMPMRCIADNVLEFVSFPVELHFKNDESGRSMFSVHGNYDWDLNDQIFVKLNDEPETGSSKG
jgi:hypothetical protein